MIDISHWGFNFRIDFILFYFLLVVKVHELCNL
ncbi:MAG: hypothetical protein RL747_380 [Bacteroidota bacterium]